MQYHSFRFMYLSKISKHMLKDVHIYRALQIYGMKHTQFTNSNLKLKHVQQLDLFERLGVRTHCNSVLVFIVLLMLC